MRWIRPHRSPPRGPHLVCRLLGRPRRGGRGFLVRGCPLLPSSLPFPRPSLRRLGCPLLVVGLPPPPPPAPPPRDAAPRPCASGRVDALVDLGPPWLGWFGYWGCRDEARVLLALSLHVPEKVRKLLLSCLFRFPKRCENFVFVSFRTWLAVCLWSGGVGWGGWGWVGGLGSFGVGFGLCWFGVGLGRCGVVWGLVNMRLNPTSWKGCVAR